MSNNGHEMFDKAVTSKDCSALWMFLNFYNAQYSYNDEYIVDQLIKNKWSLLSVVELGKLDLTKLFLESDDTIKINDVGERGWTALHQAVSDKDIDQVKLLCQYNVDPNILDSQLHTPLYYSYDDINEGVDYCEILEIIKSLVDRGAKAVIFVENMSILQLETILMNGDFEAVEYVLNLDIDLRAHYGSDGDTVLHHLAQNYYPKILDKVMHGRNFDVDARNSSGATALLSAAREGLEDAVDFFLSHGANANVADNSNGTPLHSATTCYQDYQDSDFKYGYLKCILLLLQYGADVQVVATENNLAITIFDTILKLENEKNKWLVYGLMLEHLALQKANGAQITELIQNKIDLKEETKKYFEMCTKLLVKKIYGSETLRELLSCNGEKLVAFMRNAGLVCIINDFCDKLELQTVSYSNWLQKRIDKANRTAKLRDLAIIVICKLMNIDYHGYSFIVDTILRYLEDQDLNALLSISL